MEPKSYRFDRANISTHMLMDPPHMCLRASNDVPLAGVGGRPQPRKLKDAAYGPIPAGIVYFQPLWFTVDRALFWLKEPQRVPVSKLTHGPPRFAESPEMEADGPPDDDYPPAARIGHLRQSSEP